MKDRQSLKNRNLNYLKRWYEHDPEHWINGGELEKLAMSVGYKASNSSRRMRELYEEGKVDRMMHNGSVWYRYRPEIEF